MKSDFGLQLFRFHPFLFHPLLKGNFMLSFAVLLLVQGQALRPMPYYDPAGRKPSSYAEYAATQTNEPFKARVVCRSVADGSFSKLVLVLVNSTLYSDLSPQFATWFSDMATDGFTVKVIATSGGRAANLRAVLQAHRDSGLVAGVMVGDLPVAWWEDSQYGEDYPIDLFFSDLADSFSDTDGNGIYDTQTGSAGPSIEIGRLYASRLTYAGEEQLISAYLARNHQYRTGQLMLPNRGLFYNEIDWYSGDFGLGNLYSNVTVFSDENTTTAAHYKSQLKLGYEFVVLAAHSSPWVHSFFLSGGAYGAGSMFNFEVPALEPNAAFYFINGCMCGRYTEKDCMCDWDLFAQPAGLEVMASTQLMYGLSDVSDIFTALKNDSTFGAAFLAWHQSNYSMFAGTCLLGDPTLRVTHITGNSARINPPSYRPAASLDWTEYAVDTSNFVNGNPDIGYSQGHIRLVFDSGRIVRADNYFSSFDGSAFSRPESVAWHEYYDLFPACCTDASGRFWMIWQSFRDYSSYEHFQVFSTYYYNGAWSAVQRVGPQAGYHDVQAAVGTGSNNVVWCAFKSWRNGEGDIWVSSESSAGAWATPTRLTTDSLDQIDPCVAVDHANHPWVFWTSLTHGRWQVQGRTNNSGWQPQFCLDSTGDNGGVRATVDTAGRVWVIWHKWQAGQSDIYYSYWNGSSWTAPAALTATPTDDVLPGITAAPDGTVWACWMSKLTGSWDIYTSHYAGGWTTPDPVTSDTANDYDPVMTTDSSGNIWTAWASDRRGYWNIYAAYSPLTGTADRSPSAGPHALSLSCTPNPFRSSAVLHLTTGPLDHSTPLLRVYDAQGRLVLSCPVRTSSFALRTSSLPVGVYVARLWSPTAGNQAVLKLVRTD
jgi:hypothetical protein